MTRISHRRLLLANCFVETKLPRPALQIYDYRMHKQHAINAHAAFPEIDEPIGQIGLFTSGRQAPEISHYHEL